MGKDLSNPVTLSTFASGTAEELFAVALARVLENVDDPNTDPEARRTISLTFSVVPRADRREAEFSVACSTKLAGMKPHATTVFLGRHEGQLAAVEALTQSEMFPQPTGRPVAVEG